MATRSTTSRTVKLCRSSKLDDVSIATTSGRGSPIGVTDGDGLRKALTEALAANSPALIEVMTDKMQNGMTAMGQ